jgi:hypothetical protein
VGGLAARGSRTGEKGFSLGFVSFVPVVRGCGVTIAVYPTLHLTLSRQVGVEGITHHVPPGRTVTASSHAALKLEHGVEAVRQLDKEARAPQVVHPVGAADTRFRCRRRCCTGGAWT